MVVNNTGNVLLKYVVNVLLNLNDDEAKIQYCWFCLYLLLPLFFQTNAWTSFQLQSRTVKMTQRSD